MANATVDAGDQLAALPCIRCGDCAPACPERLQPQLLWLHLLARSPEAAVGDGLLDCSQCGRCDAACPSRIPLARRFGEAKAAIRQRHLLELQAGAARARYELRESRLLRESVERAQRDQELARDAASSDAVAAAIERARARRQQARDPK